MSIQENSNALSAICAPRVKVGSLWLSDHQANNVLPAGLKHEVLIIPSSSTVAFGSPVILDYKEINTIPQDFCLQFNIGALSGITGNARFSPGIFFTTRIEILIGGQIIDTVYGNSEFLLDQMLYEDQDRCLINAGMGHYASVQNRVNLAATTSNYYVRFRTPFNQMTYQLLNPSHSIQFRAYLDQISNITTGTTITAPAATINYCNLVARITRIQPDLALQLYSSMCSKPNDQIYHQLRYFTTTLQSGISSSQIVLSGITGRVALILFTLRNSNALTQDNAFSYNQISSYAFVDSANANMVGGQLITASAWSNYLAQFYFNSSYTSETSIGVTPAQTIVNNNANVYGWSFSEDPCNSLLLGQCMTSRAFTGAESIQLNFSAAINTATQLDLYAFVETDLIQSGSGIRVVGL